MTDKARRFLTTSEAARMLETSRDTIARWCRNGEIACVVLPSGQYRIPREAVERLLPRNREDPASPDK